MKLLFRNNYIEVSLIKGLLVGAGKADDTYAIFLGCLVLEIKPWGFKRKRKSKSRGGVEL